MGLIVGFIQHPHDLLPVDYLGSRILLTNYNNSLGLFAIYFLVNFFFFFFILRRMGKNKALAHHTSTYFHTRRVSI